MESADLQEIDTIDASLSSESLREKEFELKDDS